MPTVILVEGESDRAALTAAAERGGVGLADATIVPLGGATGVARAVRELPDGIRLLGICDAAEEGHFARAFAGRAEAAYEVCDADLEDELVRALGVARVEAVLEREGLAEAFRTFQNQPFQRDRPADRQLRRFLGTASGRKIRFGALLAAELDPAELPAPIARLLAQIA